MSSEFIILTSEATALYHNFTFVTLLNFMASTKAFLITALPDAEPS